MLILHLTPPPYSKVPGLTSEAAPPGELQVGEPPRLLGVDEAWQGKAPRTDATAGRGARETLAPHSVSPADLVTPERHFHALLG